MDDYPTKSVPEGCVVGVLGLFAWIYSAMAGFVFWEALHAEKLVDRQTIMTSMAWHSGISFVVGLGLLVLGWKLARWVAPYDEWDPDEPKMKF